MAEETVTGEMKPTLGLTGLTSNAMALIAPGAFLWLTFYLQSTTKNTGPAMWWGIVGALLLCLSTAVCYAEMAKLYPGTGSSYFFAEQAFLNRDKAWKYARISKFIVGWASHLYYWIYPGRHGSVPWESSAVTLPEPSGRTSCPRQTRACSFMMMVAVVFAFAIAYIAHRGVSSSTNINLVINIIQITALLIFAFFAIQYRINHKPGSVAWQFDATSGEAYQYEFKTAPVINAGVTTDTIQRDASGVPLPKLDTAGKPIPFHVNYDSYDANGNFLAHSSAISVVSPHNWSWVFVQATIAILILVGFESVTTMGAEARNAKRDVPIAVLLSLLIQGCVFYFFELLRRQLLPQLRLQHAVCGGLSRPHRRHDGHRG